MPEIVCSPRPLTFRELDLADWTLIGRRMDAEGRDWCLTNVEGEVAAYLREHGDRLDAERRRQMSALTGYVRPDRA